MKTRFLISLLLLFSFSQIIYASEDVTISMQQLPKNTQLFIEMYFPDTKFTTIVHREKYDLYQVMTPSRWKFTFGKKGNWIDVDCNEDRVPSSLVPSPILNAIARKYGPSTKVVKITITRRGNYMIKLSNYIRLAFDKKYREMTIDMD